MFTLSQNINPNKIFIINRSELEDRIDPLYYSSELNKFNSGIFQSVSLKSVIKNLKSGIGAGKQDQSDETNGIIQIRPTNIDENGFLKFDKNIYIPKNDEIIKLEIDDVLFNNTNSQELVGKTAILKESRELSCSNHITRIRVCKNIIIPDYLWIILNIYQKNKIFYSICTNWNNQSGVGIDLLKSIKIPLPPLEIQQQIVNIYQAAYQQKQQKETQAQALLASIDDYLLGELGITMPAENIVYEPVDFHGFELNKHNPLVKNGRLFLTGFREIGGGRFDPEYYSISNKNNEIAIKQSKFPLQKISNHCVFQAGYAFKSEDYVNESDCRLITIKNISKNTIFLNDCVYLPNDYYTLFEKFQIRKDDLLIAMTGATIGKVGIYENDKKALLNQRNGIIRSSTINTFWLMNLLNTELYQSLIIRNAVGGAQPNISETNITKLYIPFPPIEKQNEIALHISEIRKQAKCLQVEAVKILENAKQKIEQMILGE